MLIRLAKPELAVLKAAAIDTHPKEAVGLLLGQYTTAEILSVERVLPVTATRIRTNDEVEIADEVAHRLDNALGDWIVGEFHSHTTGLPKASPEDKAHILDGDRPEVIVYIWPGRRKDWRFSIRAYYSDASGRIRTGRIVCV
jgi:proteasome lid subunit RPN8/RPN11